VSEDGSGSYADGFAAFLARTRQATQHSVRDVIESDAGEPMLDDDFDDALWLALCGRINSVSDLRRLPDAVRMYYATHLLEYDIGNGGLDHAVECSGPYLDEAIAGYRLLGDAASTQLFQRAQSSADDPAALENLMSELNHAPWHGVPFGNAARIGYARAHRDEFLI
jgi:hypothetical protein